MQSLCDCCMIDIVPELSLDSPQQFPREPRRIFDDLMWDLVEHQGTLLVLFFGVLDNVGLRNEEIGKMD